MQTTYDNKALLEQLFKLNDNLVVSEVTEDYLIVENVYANYEALHDYISKLERIPKGKKTNEFVNCRLRIPTPTKAKEKMDALVLKLAKEYLGEEDVVEDKTILINSMKLNVNYGPEMQHWPHHDPGITGIVYLDKISAGGTALYEDPDETMDPKYKLDTLEFGKGYFRDISKMKIKAIVPAKPNRLVVLKANHNLHGGYYFDHSKYMEKDRFHQIIFTNRAKTYNDSDYK